MFQKKITQSNTHTFKKQFKNKLNKHANVQLKSLQQNKLIKHMFQKQPKQTFTKTFKNKRKNISLDSASKTSLTKRQTIT